MSGKRMNMEVVRVKTFSSLPDKWALRVTDNLGLLLIEVALDKKSGKNLRESLNAAAEAGAPWRSK